MKDALAASIPKRRVSEKSRLPHGFNPVTALQVLTDKNENSNNKKKVRKIIVADRGIPAQ
eukprot:gene9103-6396_t